jgi:hypothetical protein
VEIVLPNGPTVTLKQISLRYTYASAFEGTREGLSSLYRKGGLETRAKHRGFHGAIQVIDPGTPALPEVEAVAWFHALEHGAVRDLNVLWFVPSMDVRVSELIDEVRFSIRWELAERTLFEDL